MPNAPKHGDCRATLSANVTETQVPLKRGEQGAPGINDDERDGKGDRGLGESNAPQILLPAISVMGWWA
jgi:hypothetical protein